MITLALDEVVSAIGGQPTTRVRAMAVQSVSTDSRTTAPDSVFFALSGENFDGHQFIRAAFERGALAAVVERGRFVACERDAADWLNRGRTLVAVDSPLEALGRLAHFHRKQLAADVIAVVGSNGKTTTKMMIDHVLKSRRSGVCSPKSFNNAIGVPITLFSAAAADEYVVVEIGTNHPGEVAALGRIAEPQIAVITSIGEEHLEGLRDLRGVATEECSILPCVRSGGFAAVNLDAPHLREFLVDGVCAWVGYGEAADAALRVTDVRQSPSGLAFRINGKFEYQLPVFGAHNAWNAAAAIAVARRLGLDHDAIAHELAGFRGPPMRGEWIDVAGVSVLNDAYNANPASMAAALDSLDAIAGERRRFVVLGEMRELGDSSPRCHEAIARRAAQVRCEALVLVGAAAKMMAPAARAAQPAAKTIIECADAASAGRFLAEAAEPGDMVLLKASRGVRLEAALDAWRAALASGSTQPTSPIAAA